jgi:hypothetical protein
MGGGPADHWASHPDANQHWDAGQGLYDPTTKYWYVYSSGQFWPAEYDASNNRWNVTGTAAHTPTKPATGKEPGTVFNPNPPSNANLTTDIINYNGPPPAAPAAPVDPYANLPAPIGLAGPPPSIF